jgi:hypothetical protein
VGGDQAMMSGRKAQIDTPNAQSGATHDVQNGTYGRAWLPWLVGRVDHVGAHSSKSVGPYLNDVELAQPPPEHGPDLAVVNPHRRCEGREGRWSPPNHDGLEYVVRTF